MRITKFGAATVAAALTFGGVAVAFADDAMPADPTLEETTTTTAAVESTTTTVVDEPESTTTTVVEEPGTPGDEQGEDGEDGNAKVHPDNHGKAVSEAAHNTPPGPGHGKAVSEVARQNHGHTKGAKGTKAPKAPKTKD